MIVIIVVIIINMVKQRMRFKMRKKIPPTFVEIPPKYAGYSFFGHYVKRISEIVKILRVRGTQLKVCVCVCVCV